MPLISMRRDVKSGLVLPDHRMYLNFETYAGRSSDNAYISTNTGYGVLSTVTKKFGSFGFIERNLASGSAYRFSDDRLNAGSGDFSIEGFFIVNQTYMNQLRTSLLSNQNYGGVGATTFGIVLNSRGGANCEMNICNTVIPVTKGVMHWVVCARINGVTRYSLDGGTWITLPNMPLQANNVLHMGAGYGDGYTGFDEICYCVGKSRHSFDQPPTVPTEALNLSSF